MAKTSESQIRASNKYNMNNTTSLIIRLNIENDKDIIEQLKKVESKAGYIKRLIREDMAHGIVGEKQWELK